MTKFYILGAKISVTNIDSACKEILSWVTAQRKEYVCVSPVSTIVDCQSSKAYCDVINSAGIATPDGMPLVWLGRIQGHSLIQRTYGPDLMDKLLKEGVGKSLKHFFYGSDGKTQEVFLDRITKRYPGIQIAGFFSPSYQEIGFKETSEIVSMINEAKADILWVGLGSPKQDFWMADHRGKLEVPVMIGVGAAFDFLAGTKPQAPKWMRKIGLEWFFRLCCEPKRLWRRYLIGNFKFVFYLIKSTIKHWFKVLNVI